MISNLEELSNSNIYFDLSHLQEYYQVFQDFDLKISDIIIIIINLIIVAGSCIILFIDYLIRKYQKFQI